MADSPTDDELLVALAAVHHPVLSFKKVMALLANEKPQWAIDDTHVRKMLGVLRGDEAAAQAAVEKARRSLDKERSPIFSPAAQEARQVVARARKEQGEAFIAPTAVAQDTEADAVAQEADKAREERAKRQALHAAANKVNLAAGSQLFSNPLCRCSRASVLHVCDRHLRPELPELRRCIFLQHRRMCSMKLWTGASSGDSSSTASCGTRWKAR